MNNFEKALSLWLQLLLT